MQNRTPSQFLPGRALSFPLMFDDERQGGQTELLPKRTRNETFIIRYESCGCSKQQHDSMVACLSLLRVICLARDRARVVLLRCESRFRYDQKPTAATH